MTQEQKDLLLKDLCARLPYGVKVQIDLQSNIYPPMICKVCNIEFAEIGGSFIGVEVLSDSYSEYREFLCKPYLFPLSSMTEEQANELFNLFGISLLDSVGRDYIKINECTGITFFLNKGFDVETHLDKLMNWLNTNHFDYRGLIPMGLAINATNLNIY